MHTKDEEGFFNEQFSVYCWDVPDQYYADCRFVSIEHALERVEVLLEKLFTDVLQRIMVTDGKEVCVFEFTNEDGMMICPKARGTKH